MWPQINFDVKTYGGLMYCIYLDPVLCIAVVSSEVEAYMFRSWLHEKELFC